VNDRKLDLVLATLRRQLEEIYGERLVRMVLYGSRARGEAEPGSDIDILIVLKGPVNPGEEITRTGGVVADLSLQFDGVVSCFFMDEERFTHRHGPFLRNIRREGIIV
jgi:predicted nucleotidyltransferase